MAKVPVLILAGASIVLVGCGSSAGHPAATTNESSTTAGQVATASLVVHGDSSDATSVPDCSGSLHISGKASSAQIGLVNCYLKALAGRSLQQMSSLVVVHSGAPVTLNRSVLRHAGDAAKGPASAAFATNGSDPFDANVAIRFADSARQNLTMDALNPNEPASKSWRLDLGTAKGSSRFPAPTKSGTRTTG